MKARYASLNLSGIQPSNSRNAHESLINQNAEPKKLNTQKEIEHTLCSALNEKIGIVNLLKARENLRNFPEKFTTASEVFDELNKTVSFGPVDLEAHCVKNLFYREEEYALLARTLSKGTKERRSCKNVLTPDQITITPFRAERDILNNRKSELNIFITPATLIHPKVKVSLYSSSYRWTKRNESRDSMPSIIYASPAGPDIEMLGKVDAFKKHFSSVSTMKSNDGFTDEFLEKIKSDDYSYAELIDEFREQPAIQKNIHRRTTLYARFAQSFPELNERLVDYQKKQKDLAPSSREHRSYPDGSIPFNEVAGRVWLWDALGVEVGAKLKTGLVSIIELQLARMSLAADLKQQGTDHPLFREFLLQQLSFDSKNGSLTKSITLKRYNDLDEADKNEVLEKIIQKLKDPISACVYVSSEPTIKGIADTEITGTDVINAVDTVLQTRLGFHAASTSTANQVNALIERQEHQGIGDQARREIGAVSSATNKPEIIPVQTLIQDDRGKTYTVNHPSFARGYHGEVFLATRSSDGKKFALKMAHDNKNHSLHVASICNEHHVVAPVWKKAGLVHPDFETHLVDGGKGILKTLIHGKTLGELIEEGLFFSKEYPARQQFIDLIKNQIEAGRYLGDLSPNNVIFEEGKGCIVIDSGRPIEGLEPQEAARLYRGESTTKYDDPEYRGRHHPNRYSLNANSTKSGKWGTYINKKLVMLDEKERERIRKEVMVLIDEATLQYLS